MEIEEAVKILRENVDEIKRTVKAGLKDSIGYILAEDICACYDQPPFDRSPLDGYALKGGDTKGASDEEPVILKVTEKVYAGYDSGREVVSGTAVRIMTGAPIPKGADAVIRQEDTDRGEEFVKIYTAVKPWQNYCYAGEDYKKGETLVKKGTYINAGTAAVLSSAGITEVTVYEKPHVAVISTGDEVISPGQPLTPGKIYDSNQTYINSRLTELGIPAFYSKHMDDDAALMAETVKELSDKADFIITTGAVSVGEKDIMHEVSELLGARELFQRVNIKPGMPTFAFVYNDTPVLALSGNPYGAVANFEILGREILARLCQNSRIRIKKVKARLLNPDKMKEGRSARRFLRGHMEDSGVYINEGNHSSGAISSMLGADCLIEMPKETPCDFSKVFVNVYMI